MNSILRRALKRDLKACAELSLRELEQTSKGHYICFVDDKDESWDVQVVLQGEKLQTSSCDCPIEKPHCIHVLAVLQHLSSINVAQQPSQEVQGKIAKSTSKPLKKTPKKKNSVTQDLLQSMDKNTLQEWVLEVFKKNKALEKQFVLSFAKKDITYDPEKVIDITQGVILSVRGKRKTLEAMKIKKIIDLLQIAIEPINTFMFIHIDSPVAYELFCAFLDTLDDFDKSIVHHSKRLGIFCDNYIEKYALSVHQIKDSKVYSQQIAFYLSSIFVEDYRFLKQHCFILVQQLYIQATTEQKKVFARALESELSKHLGEKYYFKGEFSTFLLEVSKRHEFYPKVKEFFAKQYFF
ncbi:SWIM zinc finger family protein [Myroides sp. LJL115]